MRSRDFWTRNWLELCSGDPWQAEHENPATYSRFVFPFAYKLTPAAADADYTIRFEQIDPSDNGTNDADKHDADMVGRRKYLTSETEHVMFDRTLRARLCTNKEDNGVHAKIPLVLKDTSPEAPISLRLSAPRLVLFECPRPGVGLDRDADILQTGFLIVEGYLEAARGGRKPVLDDLLLINEHFRHFDMPFKLHAKWFKELLGDCPVRLDDPDKAGKVGAIDLDWDKPDHREQVHKIYTEKWLSLLEVPLRCANEQVYQLVPDDWMTAARERLKTGRGNAEQSLLCYDDQRTYVWTCAILPKGMSALGQAFRTARGAPERFGHWIKLLNVDVPGKSYAETHAASDFERAWARDRTYARWAHFGTVYGYSYHSGAMLGSPTKEADNDPPVWKHFGGVYFDQALLLFYVRITQFRFSRALTEHTIELRQSRSLGTETIERFTDLRQRFAEFTNLYQFPLISNQQQGLEMYQLAREQFDVQTFFDEIRTEMESTHDLIELRASKNNNLILLIIAVAGLPLALTSVLAALFGVGRHFPGDLFLPEVGGILLTGIFVFFACLAWVSRARKRASLLGMLLVGITVAGWLNM